MENQTAQTEQPAEEQELGYKVFYCDNEEMAKAMAIDHILSQMQNRKEPPVVRPKIPFWRVLLGAILPVVLIAAVIVGYNLLYPKVHAGFAWAAVVLILVCLLRQTVILLVLLYQKIAPERMRRSCRFEPSCSNYMLQAIDKHGLCKGFCKGVGRLCRCHPPNGGVDLP